MTVLSFQFSIDVPNNVVAGTNTRDLQGVVQRLAQIALLKRAPMLQEQEQKLVEILLADIPMREVDTRRALMKVKALERIFNNSEWLTADKIGLLGGHGEVNPSAAAHRWKTKKQIFAMNRKGKDYFAAYQFDENYRPLPAVARVIEELEGFSPTRLTTWFDSSSSFMGGKRPRELLSSNAELVVASAAHTHESESQPA